MATRIRLQRHGRSNRPYYYIVVADQKARRDGKFIDRIGSYNPLTVPATIDLDFDKAFDWIMKGAQPSETCNRILSYKGVMYKKHLARGVRKGAMTEDQMNTLLQDWLANKEKSVIAHEEKVAKAKAAAKAALKADETKKKEDYAKKLEDAATPPVDEEVVTTEEVAEVAAEEAVVEATATEEIAEETVATEEVAETPSEETAETPAE